MQIGTDVANGTGAGQTTPSTPSGSGDDGGSGGTNCTEDPATQITLCGSLNECPGVSVDPSALAGCGFRIHPGGVIDLECLCSGALCPIGVPDTCAAASTLISGLTSLTVCQEVSEGRCVQATQPEAGTPSGCDRDCETRCGTEPDCLLLCGC